MLTACEADKRVPVLQPMRVRPSRNRDCEGATRRDVLLRCVPTELDSGRRLRRTLAAGNIALAVEAKGSRLVPERRASRALDAACTYDACARCSSEVRPRWATRASRQLIPSAIAHCSAIRRRASCGERSMTSPTRQLDICRRPHRRAFVSGGRAFWIDGSKESAGKQLQSDGLRWQLQPTHGNRQLRWWIRRYIRGAEVRPAYPGLPT